MPLADRILASVTSGFTSKRSRFRLAVTAGFLVAAVGFTTIVVNDQDGFADDVWGLSDLLGGVPQQAETAPPRGWGWHRHGGAAHRRLARAEPAHVLRSIERVQPERVRVKDTPMQLGRQSMCVRLCDGFAFPVGVYHGEQDRTSHEATCQAECPGAATALYVVPSGSDTIEDAVRPGTRKTYSELPYAFHYTTVLSDACTCHPPEGNGITSLLHDFTLRRGDAVMTATGVRVFHGGARFPYRRSDFVALAASRDVRTADREVFHAIERASLTRTPNVVAQALPSMPVARNATKALEHQASITPPVP